MGSVSARAIHGGAVGADVVVLTSEATVDPTLAAALSAVVPHGRLIATPTLAEAAAIAADTGAGSSLILVDGAVRLELPALLDLLDRYHQPSAALVLDPNNLEAPQQRCTDLDAATVLRVGADGALIESSGSAVHLVGEPNRLVAGVLRLTAADRPTAARTWTAVAHRADCVAADRFDLALSSLVRSGLPVAARTLGCYRWSRGPAAQSGAAGPAWRQRLRNASRGGDGLYSFAVVRRLSRRGTALGLLLGWRPNGVTALSLILGLVAAALVWTGQSRAWVVAAVLLQLALVVDCMDGEIARFTRRFSDFGGWLDGVGDRVKEYAIFAAAAAVAVRDGQSSGWLLALIAMALVTGRHLEDYSYTDNLAPSRRSRPDLLEVGPGPDSRARAASGSPARTTLAARPGARQRAVFWAKKVAHLPIAERYLLLSVLLLTGRPIWLLAVSIAANALALIWALGGRIVRELRSARPAVADGTVADRTVTDGTGTDRTGTDRTVAGPLDAQLDLGPLARLAAGLPRRGLLAGPFYPGVAALIAVWLGVIACLCAGLGPLAVVGALLAALITGVTCRAPVRQRFGWLLPPLLWAAEAAVAGSLLAHGPVGGALFVFLAACAYRRYDLIYSVRLNGLRPDRVGRGWTRGLGVEGRIVGVAVLLSVVIALGAAGRAIAGDLSVALLIGAVVVAVPAVADSIRQWRPDTSVRR